MPLITIFSKIDTNTFIERLTESLDHNELLAFVAELDEYVADWAFSKLLIQHFEKLKEENAEELKES